MCSANSLKHGVSEPPNVSVWNGFKSRSFSVKSKQVQQITMEWSDTMPFDIYSKTSPFTLEKYYIILLDKM